MIDEIETVHVATEGETPAPNRQGEGEPFFDILSWIIRLVGGHVTGGGGHF